MGSRYMLCMNFVAVPVYTPTLVVHIHLDQDTFVVSVI